MLNTKGKGYVYNGALLGRKFRLFAETEPDDVESGDEGEEVVGVDDEETENEVEPEKRTKKLHDLKKRNAILLVGRPNKLRRKRLKKTFNH